MVVFNEESTRAEVSCAHEELRLRTSCDLYRRLTNYIHTYMTDFLRFPGRFVGYDGTQM